MRLDLTSLLCGFIIGNAIGLGLAVWMMPKWRKEAMRVRRYDA